MRDLTARVLRLPAWARRCALFLLGAAAALGHPPFGWPLATLAALCALQVAVLAAPGWRAAAFWGWLAGAGYFAAALHWIVEPFLVDAARHGWMAPFALVFISAGLALFWALAFGLAARIAAPVAARAVALAGALAGAEYLRAVLFTGFPWASVGHAWIGTPVAQLARLAGPHGLTLLTLGLAAALVAMLARWRPVPAALAWTAGVVALAAGTLAWERATLPPPPGADAPVVRLVQPNAPQREKWDPDRALDFFDRQLAYTAAGEAPDLVVWPETSVPWFLDRAAAPLSRIAEAARGAPAVVGVQRLEPPLSYYNALAVIDARGEVAAVYDKAHLVPFGEYVPLGGMMSRFGIHGLAANEGGGYSAGPGGEVVELPGIGPALPLICYEGIFAEEVGDYPVRPRLLLLITNDAWFGRFSGPYQHLAQARLRAIEQGLPMVRAANTGVSAVIDARGRVTAEIPLGEAGWRDAALPAALPPTLYARTGDWPAILAMLAMAFVAPAVLRLLRLRRRRRMVVDAT